MAGPTRYDKRGRPKRKRPKVIKGDGSVRPYRERPSAGSGGRTRTEVGTQKSLVEALGYSRRVSGSNRRLASSLPVSRVSSRPVVDPALVPNAVTGLSPARQKQAVKAISGSEHGEGPKAIGRAALDLGTLAIPGGAAVKGLRVGSKLIRTVKSAEKAAEEAQRASRAARAASAAGRAGKAGRLERRAGRFADRAERGKVRRRVRSERARMSRRERAKDRAREVRTRTQVGAQQAATRVVLGSGAAGGGAVAAREAGRKGGKGSRALHSAVSPAALPVASSAPASEGLRDLATIPYQLGRATVEAPGAVAKGSFNSARDMLYSFPDAIEQVVTDPVGAGEMMVDDVKHRYGPLVEGDTGEFRRRVKREGGLTPFALDALIVAPPAGRLAGSAARSGRLGRRAERFMNEKRRPVLEAPGAEARSARNARSVPMRAGERAADRIRKRLTERRARAGDAVAVEALSRGASVPVRQRRALQRGVATPKARSRRVMLAEQARVGERVTAAGRKIPTARKLIKQIPRRDREAIKWALALGLRTAAHARERLPEQIRLIRANRAPDTEYGRLDNIPEIQRVIDRADEIFTPKFASTVDDLRRVEKRIAVEDPVAGIGRRDPALDINQATYRREAQQAEHLIGPRGEGESMSTYTARAREARREAGLAAPGYFPSELSRRNRLSHRAVGGTRHSERTKAYGGKLFREGIENNDPAVLVRGLERNVKRRVNWKLVSDIFERNSLPWSRDVKGQGQSMSALIKEMGRKGIDEESVVFVNPGLLRKNASTDMAPGTAVERKAVQAGADSEPSMVEAIRDASKAPRYADAEFESMKGWYAVPRSVMEELEGSFNSGPVSRTMGKMMGEFSKWMLAANTGWATFQTASNIVQAGLSGAGPLDMVRGQILWHRMKQGDRDQASAALGVGLGGDLLDRPHMGAAARGDGAIQGAVQAYQLWRESPWGRALSSKNPIQLFFKASRIPEDAVRRGVAYSQAKRIALDRMGQNMKTADRAINRLTHVMKMDPQKQVEAIMRNPDLLNDVAKGVEEFMGDYTTFTVKERMFLKNVIPFYSWIRFATRFAFFTLPIKRPITTGILYQLGRLETREKRELLGDNLPWGLGKLFFKDGKLSIDAYRGNPVLSAFTEFHEPADLMGFVPPYLQLLTDQIYDRDYFTGQDLTVEGETSGRRFVQAPLDARARILLNSLAGIFTPYRAAGEVAFKGVPQSSDALPWSPRPKRYSSPQGRESAERQAQAFRAAGGARGELMKSFAPFVPRSTSDLLATADYINAETEKERARIAESGQSEVSGAGAAIERIKQRMNSSSPAQAAIDRIKERMGR